MPELACHISKTMRLTFSGPGSRRCVPVAVGAQLHTLEDEVYAYAMSPHVRLLYEAVDWSRIKFTASTDWSSKGSTLLLRDRALAACESYSVLARLRFLPSQKDACQTTQNEFLLGIDRDRLRSFSASLKKILANTLHLPKNQNVEAKELNKHCLHARREKHSSIPASAFCPQLRTLCVSISA